MVLPIKCATCPGWYPLPEQGVPDAVYFWGESTPPTRHMDLQQATPMHRDHDYLLRGERFKYMYSGGADCWVLFEYGEAETKACPSCQENLSVEFNFCPYCRTRQ